MPVSASGPARHRPRGLDDGGVWQHLGRRDVPAPGDLVPLQPEFPYDREAPAVAHPVDPGSAPPRIGARRLRLGGELSGELLPGPFGLALLGQLVGKRVPQLDEDLDVERRIAQPLLRQRPGRPVRRRMSLLQAEAKHRLDHCGEADARTAEQPPGNFGVKELPRPVAQLGETRQVLGCRVEHGLGVCERGVECRQVRACDGVDQHGPGTLAAELHQEGAMTVPEPGCALGVNGDRTVAPGQGLDGGFQCGGAGYQRRKAVTRL